MKVLAIISDSTEPTINATRLRNRYLWSALKEKGIEVRLVGIQRDKNEEPKGPKGIETEFFQFQPEPKVKRVWGHLNYCYHQHPFCDELAARVEQISHEWQPDIIHAEELKMAAYLPAIQGKKNTAKQSATFHNIESELIQETGSTHLQKGKRFVEANHLRNLEKFEQLVMKKVDHSFAFSEVDLEKYSQKYPESFKHIHWSATRNAIHAGSMRPTPQKENGNILFIGTLNYSPNITGLKWFLKEVVPYLNHNMSITVAGSRATDEVRELLANSPVTFLDTPEEIEPCYKDCSVFAVPLLEGSGTRTKILEALALERVVVSTAIGAEGIDVSESTGVTIADDPKEFAKALIATSTHPESRETRAKAGREFILKTHDFQVVAQGMIETWQKL